MLDLMTHYSIHVTGDKLLLKLSLLLYIFCNSIYAYHVNIMVIASHDKFELLSITKHMEFWDNINYIFIQLRFYGG